MMAIRIDYASGAMKEERFNMMLSTADKEALKLLCEIERLPAAAVVRRLIWQALEAHKAQEALEAIGAV